jgi:hypothetical protein
MPASGKIRIKVKSLVIDNCGRYVINLINCTLEGHAYSFPQAGTDLELTADVT